MAVCPKDIGSFVRWRHVIAVERTEGSKGILDKGSHVQIGAVATQET